MPKRPEFQPFQRGDRWVVSLPPSMTATGRRVRKVFSAKTEAEKYAGKVRASHNSGMRAGMISATLAAQAMEAERILKDTGIGLVEAAKQAAAHVRNDEGREKFKARYDRAMLAGELHWRERYRMDMERLPRWLPKWFLDTPCGMCDRAMIERALQDGRDLARSTMDMRAARVMAVLGYRERHRATAEIQILSRESWEALLSACENDGEKRAVALLLFAGIRPDAEFGEITRIQWEDVGEQFITVRPSASKTGSDRMIPITPRLERELVGRPSTGSLAPAGWKRRWARIRKTAGVTGQDLTRHTFASHYLAWQGEDATKEAMGHTAGSSTLFRHYRRAVTKDEGQAYFQ